MYAIIKTGGKQYRVQKDDVFKVEKLDAEVGSTVTFDDVLAVSEGELLVGDAVAGYAVTAEVVEQGKNDKVIIYKYKAKKDYRRKNGHRQPYTMVKITEIGKGNAAPTPKAEVAETANNTEVKASLSMKKDELLEIAKNMGIEVSSKATKADILAAIESK